ncbi:MAG: GNAT family N-acetyltransferase [Nocardioidaceae bacterium]
MEIREIGVGDEPAVRRHWEIGKQVMEYRRPWNWYWAWESAWATIQLKSREFERTLLAAFDGGRMEGTAWIGYPLLDNKHSAFLDVMVPPDGRLRGVGSALCAHAEGLVSGRGRRTVMAEVIVGIDEVDSPGMAFAEHRGYTMGVSDGMKVVDLFETEPTWAGLVAETEPHHASYRLVTWLDRMPDELVEGYCALQEAFNTQAPMGELDVEPEVWDLDRVRGREEIGRKAGAHEVATAAVAADGSMAGVTEVYISDFTPQRGQQSGTIVTPAHRGHRLGLAVKLANHQAVRARFPDCQRLITGNADVNEHMNAVNDALGFRLVEHCHELQKKL